MFKRNVILLIVLSAVMMVVANVMVIMDIGTMQLIFALIASSIFITLVAGIYYVLESRPKRIKAEAKQK